MCFSLVLTIRGSIGNKHVPTMSIDARLEGSDEWVYIAVNAVHSLIKARIYSTVHGGADD